MADEKDSVRGEVKQSFFAKQQLIESARSAFQNLAAVLKNATLYPEAHPSLLSAADKFRTSIEDMLIGRKEVAFYFVSGELFFETISVPVDQNLTLVMEQFTTREIGGIAFRPGITSEELIRFANQVNKEQAVAAVPMNIVSQEQQGLTHIEIHQVLVVDKKTGASIKEGKKAAQIFHDAIESVKEMAHSMSLGKPSGIRRMNQTVQTMVDNILENRDAFMGLTSIRMYDEYTFAHSVNTAILAVSLGTFLSFEKPQLAVLGVAALMHDIGKVKVPHEVINKPGKLTSEEWELVKRHPVEGALILAETPAVTKLAMVAAFEHHQHGGAQGYPLAVEEARRHPFSQIVALADAYEALTAARVYYSVQMPPDQAIRILLKRGGITCDHVLIKAFVNMIGLFPIGTILKLDTGEVCLVLHQTRDLMRPRVLLLTRFDGSEKETGAEISLLETAGGRYTRSVMGTINPYSAGLDVKKYLT